MGLLGRILGLGKGKLDRAVNEAESKDVDAVYRNAIGAERKQAKEINDLHRETLGLVFQAQDKGEKLKAEMKGLERDLETAKAAQDMILGPIIVEKIDELAEEFAAVQKEHATLQKEAVEISKAADKQEQAVEQLEKQWKSATSALKADQVLKQIAERKKGLATDGSSEALRNIQNKVNEARAGRKATLASEEQSLDARLAKLREQSSKNTSASRFAEMLKKD